MLSGTCWPASLDQLVSSSPGKDPDSKRIDVAPTMTSKVVPRPLHTSMLTYSYTDTLARMFVTKVTFQQRRKMFRCLRKS